MASKPTARERLIALIARHEGDSVGALLALEAAQEELKRLAGRNYGDDRMFNIAIGSLRALAEEVNKCGV
jgi:hypothetical protein